MLQTTQTISREEIESKVNAIIDKVKADALEVERFAEQKGFGYTRLNTETVINKQLNDLYPEIHFSNSSFNFTNGKDSVIRDIYNAVVMLYPNAINKIGFDSLNEKKRTIKLTNKSSYDQYWFESYFFNTENELFSNIVKEYQNGSTVYQLTEDQFNKFKEIINFDSKETDQIIEAITPEDKIKYLEVKNSKYGNPYNVIYQIKERIDIKSAFVPVNYIKTFEALSM